MPDFFSHITLNVFHFGYFLNIRGIFPTHGNSPTQKHYGFMSHLGVCLLTWLHFAISSQQPILLNSITIDHAKKRWGRRPGHPRVLAKTIFSRGVFHGRGGLHLTPEWFRGQNSKTNKEGPAWGNCLSTCGCCTSHLFKDKFGRDNNQLLCY